MKFNIRLNKILLISIISLLLLSCGGGSDSLPSEPTVIPTGTISVSAILGPI